METIIFFGFVFVVGYFWERRGYEAGKAITEMSTKALEASGYRMTSWGTEGRKGKTASAYPQKFEKEYTLDGIPFSSYIELRSPQKNRAVISVYIFSGIVRYYPPYGDANRISKLDEIDVQTLEVRALQNFKANVPPQ